MAIALAGLLISVGPASAATLKTGDILVANANSSTAPVVLVDPNTGQQTALTSNAISPSDLLGGAYDLVLDRFGRLYVADFNPQSGDDGVFRVDVRTGTQSVFSVGPDLQGSFGLDADPDGSLVVAAGSAVDRVVRLDRQGAQTIVSDNTISGPDLFESAYDLAVARDRTILVLDDSQSGGAIIRVNPRTGQQSLLSTNTISGPDLFDAIQGVEVLLNGSLLVTDYQAFGDMGGGLIGVSAKTGQQSLVASNAQAGPDLFVDAHRTAIDLAGRYLVVDFSGQDGFGSIIRVQPKTGLQALLSDNAVSGPDLFEDPVSAIVVPPKCGGQYATIHGTPGRDSLKGTPFPDVIVGLGGNDLIKGLGAGDRLCGGPGRDRLLGGKGADRLFGGPGGDRVLGGNGRDRLFGGNGRDRLLGGKGRDRLLGGKGRDRLFGGKGRDRLRGGPGRDLQRQ